MNNTYDQIIQLLENYGEVPETSEEDRMSMRYLDMGLIDSFALINFILELEEAFDIELSPEDTQSDEFRYLGGLINLINKKQNG